VTETPFERLEVPRAKCGNRCAKVVEVPTVVFKRDFELVQREAHRALAEELVCSCAPCTICGVLGEVAL
jgi:hypothetical protein